MPAHPQKFWFVENPGKIPENSGTDVWHLQIKLNEIRLDLNFFLQKLASDKLKTFFRSAWIFYMECLTHKKISGKFSEIRAKFLRIPKHVLAPTPERAVHHFFSSHLRTFEATIQNICNDVGTTTSSTWNESEDCMWLLLELFCNIVAPPQCNKVFKLFSLARLWKFEMNASYVKPTCGTSRLYSRCSVRGVLWNCFSIGVISCRLIYLLVKKSIWTVRKAAVIKRRFKQDMCSRTVLNI